MTRSGEARMCCLDLDTFFVSVERLLDPSLEGKPVVVGGHRGSRGVVTACSYEVRTFGVRSGMSMRDASRLAPPNAVFVPTRGGTYGPYSKRVRAVLDRFSPIVRAASIDEFYIDFAGCENLYRKPEDESDDATIERVVREMCAAIKTEIGLPASAGIGGTRIIAKIASGRAKPAGVLLVPKGGERDFLLPLGVRKFPGIGPKTEERLKNIGVVTLADLIELPDGERSRFARTIASVEGEMQGMGTKQLGRERPAFSEYDPEGLHVGSISNERTFFSELRGDARVLEQLLMLAERTCWRARKRGMKARTVSVKIRYTDFETIQRSMTATATNDEAELLSRITTIYRREKKRHLPVRLVGVALSNLVEADPQVDIPFNHRSRVGHALDNVRLKWGYDAVRLGVTKPVNAKDRAKQDPERSADQ